MSLEVVREKIRRAGTIPRLFFQQCASDRPFLQVNERGSWTPYSWRTVAHLVSSAAAGLQKQGVRPGERVALLSENRLDWYIAHLATSACGAVVVPLFANAVPAEWARVLDLTRPRIVIASAECAARLGSVPGGAPLIGLDPGIGSMAFATLGQGHDFDPAALNSASGDDVAFAFSTSGSGDKPRLALLTHGNVLANSIGAAQRLSYYGLERQRFLSFLPLAHAYEHSAGFVFPLALGAEIFVSGGLDHLAAEFVSARPTIVTCIPRFAELTRGRMSALFQHASGGGRRLVNATLRLGRRRVLGEHLGVLQRLQDLVLDVLVRRKIRQRFGGRLSCLLSAGAPLSAETALFFHALGVPMHQAYGQTEAGPAITMSSGERPKPGSVGAALDGVELRIAEDGEVLVRGPNTMRGYWEDPASTAEALSGGWLHTGDIGRLDDDGDLWIFDRKRNIIKTSGGEMVAPAAIEAALEAEPGIAHAVVVGDGRAHLAALVALAPGGLPREAADAIEKVNSGLPPHARLRRHALVDEAFTISNGLLTPSLKTRRAEVVRRHGALLETTR